MTNTKAGQAEKLRALARLAAQCRLNVGDAEVHRRHREADAWRWALARIQEATHVYFEEGVWGQARLWDEVQKP